MDATPPQIGHFARAREDYEAVGPGALSLTKGDVLKVLEVGHKDGWWKCNLHGKEGIVQSKLLEVLTLKQTRSTDHQDVHMLLIGKTGAGKSSTGNTLVQNKVFGTSDSMSSCTKEVYHFHRKFLNYNILVIDSPGLKDTDIKEEGECIQLISDKLGTAFTMCEGYVDALICVISYLSRFTAEDVSAIETIQKIFGSECLDHMIIIITGGDQYLKKQGSLDFHQWCEGQRGTFGELYSKCQKRFLLIDNDETDYTKSCEQISRVCEMARELSKKNGRFTDAWLNTASAERKKFIAEYKAPHLKIKLQKKMSYLLHAIDGILSSPPMCSESDVREEIENLRNELIIENKGVHVLDHLIGVINNLEMYLNDTVKLPELRNQLEEIRFKKSEWTEIGKKVTMGLAFPVATLPFAAVAGAITGIGTLRLGRQKSNVEASIEEKTKKIEKKRANLLDWTYTVSQ